MNNIEIKEQFKNMINEPCLAFDPETEKEVLSAGLAIHRAIINSGKVMSCVVITHEDFAECTKEQLMQLVFDRTINSVVSLMEHKKDLNDNNG